MDTIDPSYPISVGAQGSPAPRSGRVLGTARSSPRRRPFRNPPTRRVRWLLHDIPYIAMLLLVLVGVVLRLPVLTGHSDAGLRHHLDCRGTGPFRHAEGTYGVRLQGDAGLVCAPARHLLLYDSGVQGVMIATPPRSA